MRHLRILALASVFLVGLTAFASAAQTLVRKVDSFDFLVDYSGSMMLESSGLQGVKMTLAKDIMTRVNNSIPDLGYESSLHTFGPVSTVAPAGKWLREDFAKAIASLNDKGEVFGRLTPLGEGIKSVAPDYLLLDRPTAVILVSDGDSNSGTDPVEEASALINSQALLCLHVISLADSPAGQATLDKIAALTNCTVKTDGASLLQSQDAVDQFVRDVFYTVEQTAAPSVPAGASIKNVNFSFDSSALDDQARAILDEASGILLSSGQNSSIAIEGWTDSTGDDAYNAGLSQRRADAVRAYLLQKGVPAASVLRSTGRGESHKYDNSTAEGRHQNRRIEILLQN
ncbi:MAG: OmpA family protein [Deltaproteobacteria bacterium]|jgi:OOP family OmpA-OmpF porin|nr:OmpA family protein [Deltaproteobacteria bacterium]